MPSSLLKRNTSLITRLATGIAITAASFLPMKSAALDTDKDGLSNTLEGSIGTSTTVYDTDGDGFPDGVEHYKVGANPLDNALPEASNQMYFNDPPEQLYLGSNHIFPIGITDDPDEFIYFETSNFTTGTLGIATIDPFSKDPLVTIETYDQQQAAFNNNRVFFSDKRGGDSSFGLYRVQTSSLQVTKVINTTAHIHDPWIVDYPSATGLGAYLFAATENYAGAGISNITAFPLNSNGTVDEDEATTIVNIADFGLTGKECMPRLDPDGKHLLWVSRMDGFTNTQARTFYSIGTIEDILNGETSVITTTLPPNDPGTRAVSADIEFDLWHVPIGLSSSGNVFLLFADKSKMYNHSSIDFSLTDFELYIGVVTPTGFGGFNRIPGEANQFMGITSRAGTQLFYGEDGFTTGTFSIHQADNVVGATHRDDVQLRLVDASGTELTLSEDAATTFPGASRFISMRTLSSEAGTTATQGAQVIREFGPEGLQFSSGMLLIRYADNELAPGTNENTLTPAKYNQGNGQWNPIAVMNRNPTANHILGEIFGFSIYGLTGGLPEPLPSTQANPQIWNLYK